MAVAFDSFCAAAAPPRKYTIVFGTGFEGASSAWALIVYPLPSRKSWAVAPSPVTFVPLKTWISTPSVLRARRLRRRSATRFRVGDPLGDSVADAVPLGPPPGCSAIRRRRIRSRARRRPRRAARRSRRSGRFPGSRRAILPQRPVRARSPQRRTPSCPATRLPATRLAHATEPADEHRVVGERRRSVDDAMQQLVVPGRREAEAFADRPLLRDRELPALALEIEDLAGSVVELGAGVIGRVGDGHAPRLPSGTDGSSTSARNVDADGKRRRREDESIGATGPGRDERRNGCPRVSG